MKKVLSIILAVVMLLSTTCVVFAADVDSINTPSSANAYGDLTVRNPKAATSGYFDSTTVLLTDGVSDSFDFNATLNMDEVRAAYVSVYGFVMASALTSRQKALAKSGSVSGEFTFVLEVPEGITIPETVINGSNLEGFEEVDKAMWKEVDRSFADNKFSITVQVKDGITAEQLFNNRETYLGSMNFVCEGCTASQAGSYTLNGKMSESTGTVTIAINSATPRKPSIKINTKPLNTTKGIAAKINVTENTQKAEAAEENARKVEENTTKVEEAVTKAKRNMRKYLESEEYMQKQDSDADLKILFKQYVADELSGTGIEPEKVTTEIEFTRVDKEGKPVIVAFDTETTVSEGTEGTEEYVEKTVTSAESLEQDPDDPKSEKAFEEAKGQVALILAGIPTFKSDVTEADLEKYVTEIQNIGADRGLTVACSYSFTKPTTSSKGEVVFTVTINDQYGNVTEQTITKEVDKKTDGGGGTGGGGGNRGGSSSPLFIINNDTTTTTTIAAIPDALNGSDHIAYIIGYEDGTSRPENNISRAEVATIFYRLLKPEVRNQYNTTENKFSDVSESDWFNTEVSTMANMGIVKGRTESTFEPDAPITRAEYAAICARFDKSEVTGTSAFSDIIGHWAKAEIDRVAQLGWITGYTDNTFRPDVNITRAESMTLTNRVLHRLPEDASDLLSGMITFPDNQPTDWYYLAVQEASNAHNYTFKTDGIHEKWTSLK